MKASPPVSTGSQSLDALLCGGIRHGELTLIHGPAGTGKTTLCLQLAANYSRNGKVLFVDAEHTFRPERLRGLLEKESYEEALEKIMIVRPASLGEQSLVFEKLDQFAGRGLVIADTVTGLYRLFISTAESAFPANRELNRQLAYALHWAKTLNMAVVATSQVRSTLDRVEEHLPVATRIVKYWASRILRLEMLDEKTRRAFLEKDGEQRSRACVDFTITEKGIRGLSDQAETNE